MFMRLWIALNKCQNRRISGICIGLICLSLIFASFVNLYNTVRSGGSVGYYSMIEEAELSGRGQSQLKFRSERNTKNANSTASSSPARGQQDADALYDADADKTENGELEPFPRILCWILCDPSNLETKVKYVRDTWTKRCDIRLFISSANDSNFPTIGVNALSGREHLSTKGKAAWIYVYNNYYDKADYFIKADPDTYMIVENLREFLYKRDPTKPEYIGHLMKIPGAKFFFTAGGPGVILSRESLRRLVVLAYPMKPDCVEEGEAEDFMTCQCLWRVGASAVDAIDDKGRRRFIIFSVEDMLMANFPEWSSNVAVLCQFHFITSPLNACC